MGAVGVNSLETACSTVNRQHEIKYRCISCSGYFVHLFSKQAF
jgi:hypothetical protein